MKVKLSKWGNSLAVRIPSRMALEAGLREGSSVDMEALADGELRLRALPEEASLDELVAAITAENRHEESDWGEPEGNEVW